jgi:hypothetical protein
MSSVPPTLFSPRRRAAQLARASSGLDSDFIAALIAESLADRLTMVTREFERALLIAAEDHPIRAALVDAVGELRVAASPSVAEAVDGGFDLIVWPGGLESIDDVPGALVQARNLLRGDGMLTGAMVGDGSFPMLRRLLAGDGMRGAARMHPQIDLKSLGNLLQRTGFALPVCDVEAVALRYRSWRAVVRDLRAGGLAGQLAAPPPPLTRAELAALDRNFAAASGPDGAAEEALRIIFFTGWAPHPDQPKPARRGSGKSSLAEALKAINPQDD